MVARKLLPPYSRPYSPHNESQLPPSPPPHPNVIPLNVHKEHWKNSTPKIPFRHQPEQTANTPQTQHPQGEIFEEVVFNSKNDSIKLYFMCVPKWKQLWNVDTVNKIKYLWLNWWFVKGSLEGFMRFKPSNSRSSNGFTSTGFTLIILLKKSFGDPLGAMHNFSSKSMFVVFLKDQDMEMIGWRLINILLENMWKIWICLIWVQILYFPILPINVTPPKTYIPLQSNPTCQIHLTPYQE